MNTRRDTFGGMDRFFDQFNRAMSDRMFDTPWMDQTVRMERVEDTYRVVVDLPGFERESIDLTYHDDELTITATQDEHDDTTMRRSEVHERVTIPAEVDSDAITATYRNGVLEVTLPVIEVEETGKHIDIE